MKRISVNSNKLLSVGYDAKLQVLEIEFNDHNVYQFVNATAAVYAALINATDKYAYYVANIMYEFAGLRVYP